MSRTLAQLSEDERDYLFPEFRGAEDETETAQEDDLQAPVRPQKDPVLLSVMAKLAGVLGRETDAIRTGSFDEFTDLQREKAILIQQAERLQNSPKALEAVEAFEPETLQSRLESFNSTVESNMRTIGAVKDAITHIRTQAIRRLEEEKGDGTYRKDGEKKSLHRLSLNETQVKL